MIQRNEKITSLRAGLLNWYPFPGGDRALLVGTDTEPLRPLLEGHYRRVDREIPGMPAEGEDGAVYACIDAVLPLGPREDMTALLARLYSLLAEDGLLLLAFRNRFGIKYLCGARDACVEVPFSVLDPAGRRPGVYGRREMEGLLRRAGFGLPRFYYLMPDMDFVQAVYTDEWLPDESIRDRMLPFDLYESPLMGWEGDLYDDMVREGTLPYACNVYLAECRRGGAGPSPDRVIYAALSTDRGREHGFATLLRADGTAVKRPLWPEGEPALEAAADNLDRLRDRGILTVPQTRGGGEILMPLIREEGLLHYLRRQIPGDPEAFLRVFEDIYADVLRSSPPAEEPLPADMAQVWGAPSEALRPVLDRAMIDMIPYNAFRAGDRIRYYDQEFAVRCCPAAYVLFRAIFYTWIHIPEAGQVLPLEEVKARFGLTALWEGFRRREEAFVRDNRNREGLAEIYAHAGTDRRAMDRRRRELAPDVMMREVHAVQLELLHELDRACKAGGLRYMAMRGTLLGAARHGGFIPWGDDAAVAMPREDYDRLLKAGDKGFREGFHLQTPDSDPGCFCGGYSRLRRDGTMAVEPRHRGLPPETCHQGIWIDILPLDRCPESPEDQESLQDRLRHLQRTLYAATYTPARFVPADVPGSQLSHYYQLAETQSRRDLVRQLDSLCRGSGESSLRGILAAYYGNRKNRNIWPAAWVDQTLQMPFEDMMLPVPAGWDAILRARYGDTYMQLPPARKRYRRSEILYDTGTGRK